MSLLVRKIDKVKWLQNGIASVDNVSADAITNCIKTTNNTLSTWRIDSEAQVDEAVLAIVSGNQHLDTIDVVWVSQEKFETEGISIQDSPGATPIPDFVNRHVDVVDLNYKSLGSVANCILKCLSENSVKRYTRGKLKELLRNAIDTGRLPAEKIEPSIVNKL